MSIFSPAAGFLVYLGVVWATLPISRDGKSESAVHRIAHKPRGRDKILFVHAWKALILLTKRSTHYTTVLASRVFCIETVWMAGCDQILFVHV